MTANTSSIICLIFFCSLNFTTLNAQTDVQETKEKLRISLASTYFREDLKWSIAGDAYGGSPNILSELIWRDLKGPQFELSATWNVWKSLRFKTNITSSFITSGTVSDTDYLTDNRTNAAFKMMFDSNRGTILSFHVHAGYAIIHSEYFWLTTYLGYGENHQSLFLLGAEMNEHLRSTYKTIWKGPVGSIETRVKFATRIFMERVFEYQQLNYNAKANWNLIQSFQHPVSFEHSAKGYRISIGNKIRYRFSSGFSLAVTGNYSSWKTGKGIDKLYLINNTTATTQFNAAVRKTFSLGIEASIDF